MRRIGLFGGTFNPIHRGHVQAALDAQAHLGLDQVVLIPSAQPPHKPSIDLAGGADRLAMIRLAVADYPVLGVDPIELNRPGPSYTIDTVNFYANTMPRTDRLHFIVGLDAFLEMDGWHRYRDIFKTIAIAVMTRPGILAGGSLRSRVEGFVREKVSPAFHWREDPPELIADGFAAVALVAVTPVAVSATQIRAMVRQGRRIASLVHPAVERHIAQRGLYR
jgi:nicotinate-nucleotide adenylyltransferase